MYLNTDIKFEFRKVHRSFCISHFYGSSHWEALPNIVVLGNWKSNSRLLITIRNLMNSFSFTGVSKDIAPIVFCHSRSWWLLQLIADGFSYMRNRFKIFVHHQSKVFKKLLTIWYVSRLLYSFLTISFLLTMLQGFLLLFYLIIGLSYFKT